MSLKRGDEKVVFFKICEREGGGREGGGFYFSCVFCVFFAASTENAKLGIGVSLLGQIGCVLDG